MELLPWKIRQASPPSPFPQTSPDLLTPEFTSQREQRKIKSPKPSLQKNPKGGESCTLFADRIWDFIYFSFCWDVRSTLPGEGNVFLSRSIHSSYRREGKAFLGSLRQQISIFPARGHWNCSGKVLLAGRRCCSSSSSLHISWGRWDSRNLEFQEA